MTSHAVDEVVVLQPRGDLLEGAACDDLERALGSLAGRGRRVIVDLSGTRVLTAHCLGLLARAQQLASANGGGLALCGAAGPQRWLLGVTHLADALPLYESESEAVVHLNAGRAVAQGGRRIPPVASNGAGGDSLRPPRLLRRPA